MRKRVTSFVVRLRGKVQALISRGFFHIFFANALNQVVRFAYGILILRVISKSSYGVFAATRNIYAFFFLLSGFGIASAVLQLASEHAEDEHMQERYLQFGYRFGLRVNAGLSLAIAATALLVPLPIEGTTSLLLLMALLPLPEIIKGLQMIWLRAHFKNKQFALINTIEAVSLAGLALLLAWLLDRQGLIVAQYVSVIVCVLIMWRMMHVPFMRKAAPLRQDQRRDLIKIAGITTVNNATGELLGLLGTFILGLVVRNENAVASFQVASVLPGALTFIPMALMTYLYPYFAQHRDNGGWVRTRFAQTMVYAGAFQLLIAAGGVTLAPLIVRVLFGPAYADVVIPFRILMVNFFISGTFRIIPGNLLVTQRKLMFNLYLGIAGALLSILFNVLLIPRMGSDGAAIAQLIVSSLTGAAATLYFVLVSQRIKK